VFVGEGRLMRVNRYKSTRECNIAWIMLDPLLQYEKLDISALCILKMRIIIAISLLIIACNYISL